MTVMMATVMMMMGEWGDAENRLQGDKYKQRLANLIFSDAIATDYERPARRERAAKSRASNNK